MCSHSRFLTTGMQLSGEGNGNPLQYSCLGIPWIEEPGGLQSMGSLRVGHDWVTSLSLFTFMHWRRKWHPTPVFLPGESQGQEPGGLPSMGSHRVRHYWRDLAVAAAAACNFPQAGKKKMLLVPDVPDSSISMKCLLSSTTHQCPRFWPRDGLQRVNSGIFFFCSLLG